MCAVSGGGGEEEEGGGEVKMVSKWQLQGGKATVAGWESYRHARVSTAAAAGAYRILRLNRRVDRWC
jgi:hypothetical protein